jgi:putative flippase GtrA
MLSRKTIMFLICGSLAAAINWLARICLSQFMSFEMALVLAYGIGMVAGFALYRNLVWPGIRSSIARQVTGFVAVNAVSGVFVVVSAVLMVRLAETAFSPSPVIEATAHAIAIALGAVANYVGHGRLTFRSRPV